MRMKNVIGIKVQMLEKLAGQRQLELIADQTQFSLRIGKVHRPTECEERETTTGKERECWNAAWMVRRQDTQSVLGC